jgi:PIN domain nuclease of toxin-antitoxin system
VRYLLDTHAFLWAAAGDPKLSSRAQAIVSDPMSELFLSAASAYEIGVKVAHGGIELPDEPGLYLLTRMAVFGIRSIPVTAEHAVAAAALPRLHADPWDRLLVAQARIEDMPILTKDVLISRYEVTTIW